MQTHFEKDLADLKSKLLVMASHAESAVKQALDALASRDAALAESVREGDHVVDQYELEIDEQSIQLLAKAPLASDLRLITVAMKVCQNLERVGDEATKIAKKAIELSEAAPLKLSLPISQMAELVLGLLRTSLDSFVNNQPAVARALIPQDKAVDALNRQIHQGLVDKMIEDPSTVQRCLAWMVVAKSLERVGDHAKNVAEEVVYLVEAEDIRHRRAAAAAAAGKA